MKVRSGPRIYAHEGRRPRCSARTTAACKECLLQTRAFSQTGGSSSGRPGHARPRRRLKKKNTGALPG